MNGFPEGNAIIYCEGAFSTSNGKTAHGLIRRSERYNVLSVVDSRHAGNDAGYILDGRKTDIPIHYSIPESVECFKYSDTPASHLVVSLAPDGGRLCSTAEQDIRKGIELGLHIDSGLHDLLSEYPSFAELSAKNGIKIRDIRKTPPLKEMHFFTGKIEQVSCARIAVLGTDSAVGKRTTAWMILDELRKRRYGAEFVGTGQTAWMQGAKYSIILDSLVNDFVSGEIEHAVWQAWKECNPDFIILEGQGSLLNPAYPGGFEILAGGRPDIIVLQHAPGREDYDGFPDYPLHPLEKQIQALEIISGKPVIVITVNHENLDREDVPSICEKISHDTGIPSCDMLLDGPQRAVDVILSYLDSTK